MDQVGNPHQRKASIYTDGRLTAGRSTQRRAIAFIMDASLSDSCPLFRQPAVRSEVVSAECSERGELHHPRAALSLNRRVLFVAQGLVTVYLLLRLLQTLGRQQQRGGQLV